MKADFPLNIAEAGVRWGGGRDFVVKAVQQSLKLRDDDVFIVAGITDDSTRRRTRTRLISWQIPARELAAAPVRSGPNTKREVLST